MKSLILPAGTTHVLFSELAHRIADALWPDKGPTDIRIKYGAARVNLDAELLQAVEAGALELKDPLTLGPHTFPLGAEMLTALVTVDALQAFIAGRGLTLAFTDPQSDTVEVNEFGHPKLNFPQFTLPDRVQCVDPGLLALDPDSQVRVLSRKGAGVGLVRDLIDEIREIVVRQAESFYTVAEASGILADSPAGGDAHEWREKIYGAWHADDLVIRDTTRTKKSLTATERDFMDLVKESDLDAWLEDDGAGYLFPKVAPSRVNLETLATELSHKSAVLEYGSQHASDAMAKDIAATLHKIGFPETGLPGIRPHILKMVKDGEIGVLAIRNKLAPVNLSDVTAENFDKWDVSPEHADKARGKLFPEPARAPVASAAPPFASDGTVVVWTNSRIDEARTMMNKFRGEGVKAYAARTAKTYGVTTSRLRQVLNGKSTKPSNFWTR